MIRVNQTCQIFSFIADKFHGKNIPRKTTLMLMQKHKSIEWMYSMHIENWTKVFHHTSGITVSICHIVNYIFMLDSHYPSRINCIWRLSLLHITFASHYFFWFVNHRKPSIELKCAKTLCSDNLSCEDLHKHNDTGWIEEMYCTDIILSQLLVQNMSFVSFLKYLLFLSTIL